MSLSDGQRVNAAVTNAAYVSRTTDSDTVGVVGLNNVSSGGLIPNAQQQINDNASNISSNDTEILDLQTNKEDKVMTTKGDLMSRTASAVERLGVGSDGQILTADSSEATGLKWVEASGGSTSGINYALNPGAEVDASDQTAYDDGAVSEPVDGDGGSPSVLSVARTTTASEVLVDAGSFKVSKTAADGQGEGIRLGTNPIDGFYKEKEHWVIFKYKMLDSNYTDGDLAVFIYDVDNATLIGRVRNDDNGDLLNHEGEGRRFLGFFNATDSLNYRVLVHQTSTNALATDWVYDDVVIGPAEGFVPATPEFDEVFDMNGSGDFTGGTVRVRRTGNQVFLNVETTLTCTSNAAPASGNFLPDWALPTVTERTVDSLDASVLVELNVGTAGNIQFERRDYAGASNASSSYLGGIAYSVENQTNVVSNTNLTQQTIEASGAGNAGGSVTANVTNIDFTETNDVFGAWNGTQFTAPRSAQYFIVGSVRFTAANSARVSAYIDGTSVRALGRGDNLFGDFKISGEVYLERGEVLSFRSDSSLTLSNIAEGHWIFISSKPDFTNYGVLNPASEVLSATGTYTPGTGSWSVSSALNLTDGTWRLKGIIISDNDANASTEGIRANLSTGTSTGSSEDLTVDSIPAVGNWACNNTRGGSGEITTDVVITSSTNYYIKAIAYANAFDTAVTWALRAVRIR